MRKKEKKSILEILKITAICMLTLGSSVLVGRTVAYQTEQETTTNIVTYGNVDISLTEPNFPGNSSTAVKNLEPHQEVAKDPKITNTGSNGAIVFMKVTVPVKNVTMVDFATRQKEAQKMQEIFYLKDDALAITDHKTQFDSNWIELTAAETGTDYTSSTRTYVFAYKTKLAKDATTTSLFNKVQLRNVLEASVTSGETQNILIDAYAIQDDDIITSAGVEVSDNLTAANLLTIYNTYVKQNTN